MPVRDVIDLELTYVSTICPWRPPLRRHENRILWYMCHLLEHWWPSAASLKARGVWLCKVGSQLPTVAWSQAAWHELKDMTKVP